MERYLIINFLCLFLYLLLFIRTSNINISHRNIIVTGASSNHELSLIQFIYHCFNTNHNIILIVWDLGFSNYFMKLMNCILKHNKYIIYKKFNYTNYPSYFNINKSQGVYAWKPVIINITLYVFKKTILWLDSGCVVKSKLDLVFREINKYQCFSTYTSGSILQWTHIGMIRYYQLSANITKRRTCNGAIVGFKWNSIVSKTILNKWVECAYNINCIAPNGSNVKNHRQDQSSLSILLYKYNIFTSCPDKNYNIISHKDIHNKDKALKIYNSIINTNYI